VINYVGVDGCKAGWFAVAFSEDGTWEHGVFDSADALLRQYGESDRIYIDIPIGLVEGRTEERKCDLEARQLLGKPRSSSVFPVPSRAAISASNYDDAVRVNRQETGRGLSLPAWGILPKIREVEHLMQQSQPPRDLLIEVHPELLFWALNGREPMKHHKSHSEGRSERLEILRHWLPATTDEIYKDALDSYLRKNVARDDILDALVAAVTGYRSNGDMSNVPEPPEIDPTGLPMRMGIPNLP